jgi:molecular chaperone DnaK
MNIKVTRAKLESLVEDLVNRSIEPLKVAAGCWPVRV